MKIPFSLSPSSWFLSGVEREIAKAQHELSGYELDRKIAELKYPDNPLKALGVDYQYGKISATDYDKACLPNDLSPEERRRAILKIAFKNGDIGQREFEEKIVDLDYPKATDERKIALSEIKLKYGEISDYEHAMACVKIKHKPKTEDYIRAVIDVEYKFGNIDEYERDLRLCEVEYEEGLERSLAKLEIDYAHNKVDKLGYDKEKATLKNEPWIDVIDHGFNPELGINGVYFEFDWNDHWILYLRANGYRGATETEVVDNWFSDVCKSTGASVNDGVVPFPGYVR